MAQFKKQEEYAAEMKFTFKVHVSEGTINVPQQGTEKELAGILRRYNTEGLILKTQSGFVWYPTASIKKIEVIVL